MERIIRRIFYPKIFYNELKKQIKELDINNIFPEEEIKNHWKHGEIRDTMEHPDLYITQIRYYRMHAYFKDLKGTILDIGDSSGILLNCCFKNTSRMMNLALACWNE